MEIKEKIYKLTRIDGEYAYLSEVGAEDNELFIAMALLPLAADEGSIIRFSGFEYELLE